MVVPYCRVAAEVVYDHSTVGIRSCDTVRCGVANAGRPSTSADVGEGQVICPVMLEGLYPFVEMVA